MSTAFHVSTYLRMGDDFDSRNRFLAQPSDAVYEGQVVAGESWSVNVTGTGNNTFLALRFKMGSYVFTPASGGSLVPVDPSGSSTGVRSE